jgi:Arc/MetJ-type ribon-helix-helix transcriptional regulator
MSVRLTISLPDDLDQAVRAAAGDNVSAFTQRALRNALAARDVDLIVAHSQRDDDGTMAAAMEADVEAELADQKRRRAS